MLADSKKSKGKQFPIPKFKEIPEEEIDQECVLYKMLIAGDRFKEEKDYDLWMIALQVGVIRDDDLVILNDIEIIKKKLSIALCVALVENDRSTLHLLKNTFLFRDPAIFNGFFESLAGYFAVIKSTEQKEEWKEEDFLKPLRPQAEFIGKQAFIRQKNSDGDIVIKNIVTSLWRFIILYAHQRKIMMKKREKIMELISINFICDFFVDAIVSLQQVPILQKVIEYKLIDAGMFFDADGAYKWLAGSALCLLQMNHDADSTVADETFFQVLSGGTVEEIAILIRHKRYADISRQWALGIPKIFDNVRTRMFLFAKNASSSSLQVKDMIYYPGMPDMMIELRAYIQEICAIYKDNGAEKFEYVQAVYNGFMSCIWKCLFVYLYAHDFKDKIMISMLCNIYLKAVASTNFSIHGCIIHCRHYASALSSLGSVELLKKCFELKLINPSDAILRRIMSLHAWRSGLYTTRQELLGSSGFLTSFDKECEEVFSTSEEKLSKDAPGLSFKKYVAAFTKKQVQLPGYMLFSGPKDDVNEGDLKMSFSK